MVVPEEVVLKVLLVQRDHKGQLESQVIKEQLVLQEIRDQLANKDRLVMMEHPVSLEPQEHQVLMAREDILVERGQQDNR